MMERWPFWPTLVLVCFLTLWYDGKAQTAFTIDWVKLTLLPGTMLESGSNLTLRCEVKVSQSSSQLMHTLRFLMDGTVIYSKNTSEAVVEYSITPARASHSGRYICQAQIFEKVKDSSTERLTVTGLQTPQLKVQPIIVNEGDEVMATCSAPEEPGALHVFLYESNQEIHASPSKDNSVAISVKVQKSGNISFHCKYMLLLHPTAGSSNNSNTVNIFVRELSITPSIRISPNAVVVEGDQVHISCNVSDYSQNDLEVFLTKDTVLRKHNQSFSYSFVVTANDSGEYICKTEKGNVQKSSNAQLEVVELFSRPVLSMSPRDVFEEQQFNLSCRSLNISTTHIAPRDVKYSLYKDKKLLIDGHRILASKASSGSYYCEAKAKGITKTSMPLVINVKVPVSAPVIHTVGKMIMGQPFQVQCESEHGTLPITYTLLKFQKPVARMAVTGPQRGALFNISSINYKNESHSFSCLAMNPGTVHSKASLPLSTPVIEIVSTPVLTLKPKGYMITEGVDLTLYCSVQQGTVPITFTWYRKGVTKPLNTTRISKTQGSITIKSITRNDEGRYYCQARNEAKEAQDSIAVFVQVNLASWKKVLIGVSCIVLLVLIVIILVIFLKKAHTPQKNKRATELSVKSAHAKSNDPMRVSLTLDIEDNTTANATPGVMGRNVWSDHVSSSESDQESKKDESEKFQDSDELPLQNVDCGEELVMHDTDTVKDDFQDITKEKTEETDQVDYVHLNNCELEPQKTPSSLDTPHVIHM